MDRGLLAGSKGKNVLMMDLFATNMQLFASQVIYQWLESGDLLMDYCNVFISCLDWRHPFTAKDPLMSKWSNAKSLQIWNKLILDDLTVN